VPLAATDESGQVIQLMLVSQSTPSGHAIAGEELARLEHAIYELTPRYEQVVHLRNELKLSFVEFDIAVSCSDDGA
jgi:DNA-directed RNA polymerase specialized sigma24 family protein